MQTDKIAERIKKGRMTRGQQIDDHLDKQVMQQDIEENEKVDAIDLTCMVRIFDLSSFDNKINMLKYSLQHAPSSFEYLIQLMQDAEPDGFNSIMSHFATAGSRVLEVTAENIDDDESDDNDEYEDENDEMIDDA